MLGGLCGVVGVGGSLASGSAAAAGAGTDAGGVATVSGGEGNGCCSSAAPDDDGLSDGSSSAMMVGIVGGVRGLVNAVPSTCDLGIREGPRGCMRGGDDCSLTGASSAAPSRLAPASTAATRSGFFPASMMLPRLEKDIWVMNWENSSSSTLGTVADFVFVETPVSDCLAAPCAK